jgi:ABC-type branched-subunit amino acid transport system substrate-binding protein
MLPSTKQREELRMSYIARIAAAIAAVIVCSAVHAQDVVKIGQIEAQTGPNAIYGYMGSQGVPMAVDEINKAGGFKVGDKTYKIELISLDTRGDPKEATIQLKRLLEQEKAKFVFGPFLSNVFVTVLPYAKQFNEKFLLMGGATRIHDFVGQPGHDFVIRTWNWDAGPNGFGERMVDYLIKTANPKKVAMLFQNDQGGKVLGESMSRSSRPRGSSTLRSTLSPAPRISLLFWQRSRTSRRITCFQDTPTRRSTTLSARRLKETTSGSSS